MRRAMSEFRPNHSPLVPPGQVEHHAADMTATIAADVTLADVQAKLGSAGQWLPIDGDPQSPVGRLVEANSSGPLRLGYGHWRDLLLGAQFRNGRGELITAGGRTVKNVAGYDLTKFMVGQRGVFGTLVTITTRTYKQPAGAILATFAPQPKLIHRLLPSPARPQWAMLTSDALLCGYMGDERTLAYYFDALNEWKPRALERRSLSEDIAHRAQLWRGSFRAAVPPASLSDFLTHLAPVRSTAGAALHRWSADPAFGIIVGDGDPTALRDAARTVGGTVSFDAGAADTWFDVPPGAQRDLLERLKQAFDPENRLAPLPWQTTTT